MKSGMVTITASMPFSRSSILRKSLYLGTLSYSLNFAAACRSSTSQSATMFSRSEGDDPRVNALFPVEHPAEVLVLGNLVVLLELRRGLPVVHVAERHDVLLAAALDVVAGLAARANGSDVQLLIGRLVAQAAERGSAAEPR